MKLIEMCARFVCVLFWRYYFDVRSPYALFVHSHTFPVTMDFKGFQYQGIIHPGPTAMIASVNKGGVMKVEAITDEFVTLEKDVIDVMARLDAQVKGDLDEGYSTKGHDTNVNYSGARGGGNDSAATNDGAGSNKKGGGGKKRAGGGGSARSAGGASAKKRKAAPKK